MLNPRLETVERHWLVILVQLVGEEFTASEQQWQITDSEHADAANRPTVTARVTPVSVDRQPRLAAWVPYTPSQSH